jgi:hypothetical protein
MLIYLSGDFVLKLVLNRLFGLRLNNCFLVIWLDDAE